MSNRYAETFEQRGHPYDQAMMRFPDCRSREFIRLFDHLDLQVCSKVLDLPSGGGYLDRFLPDHCLLDSADPSTPFRTSGAIYPIDLENLTLPAGYYDLVISLAALHHIQNKTGFLRSVVEALKPGGRCCFADVAADSGVRRFLDEFAGRYNNTGHSGHYLEVDTPYPGAMDHENLVLIEHALKPCPWVFPDTEAMIEFCRLLFGLKQVSDQQILTALDHYIGFSQIHNSQGELETHLHWELLFITFQTAMGRKCCSP